MITNGQYCTITIPVQYAHALLFVLAIETQTTKMKLRV